MSTKFHPDNLDTGINKRLDFVILKEEDGTLTISSRCCDGYHWKNCAGCKSRMRRYNCDKGDHHFVYFKPPSAVRNCKYCLREEYDEYD